MKLDGYEAGGEDEKLGYVLHTLPNQANWTTIHLYPAAKLTNLLDWQFSQCSDLSIQLH